jgi:rubrerythrin
VSCQDKIMSEAEIKTMEALKTAIEMEKEGRDFYLAAASGCGNAPGRRFYEELAREEELHLGAFTKIFEAIRLKNAWPGVSGRAITEATGQKPLRAGITPELCQLVKPEEAEIEAVKTAIRMENDSYEFYWKEQSRAAYPAEKEFFNRIAKEENAHRLALLDYLEFLLDPASYFVNKEHPNLD